MTPSRAVLRPPTPSLLELEGAVRPAEAGFGYLYLLRGVHCYGCTKRRTNSRGGCRDRAEKR